MKRVRGDGQLEFWRVMEEEAKQMSERRHARLMRHQSEAEEMLEKSRKKRRAPLVTELKEDAFEKRMTRAAERARRKQYSVRTLRIDCKILDEKGGIELLTELQSYRKPDSGGKVLQEWPGPHFDVELVEDEDGFREIIYLDKPLKSWNIDSGCVMIHAVWTLYGTVGFPLGVLA